MASPLTGCKEEEIVFIETGKLDLTIKGMPCHPKAECLNLNQETSSQLKVRCQELLQLSTCFQAESQKNLNFIQTIPLFFEQQNYQIIIENKGSYSLEFWHENSLLRNKVRPIGKSQKILSGIVNFGSEIGFSELIIKADGIPYLTVEIEVFPSKLDYQKDFIQIRNDITQEIYNLAFDFLKRTYLLATTKETVGNNIIEFFSILKLIFEKFIGSVNLVIQTPHHVLQSENVIVQPHKLRKTDASTIKWLEKKAQHMICEAGEYLPQKVLITKKTVCFDTFENRFVKYILSMILKRITQFKDSYIIQDKKSDEYVLQTINGMYREIQKRIEYSFLRNVGDLHTVNSLSLVLNMAPGYKDVYKYYLILIKGLSFQGEIFKISVKDLATLYEYWCFIKLNSLFRKKYKMLSQDFIKADYRGLVVTLKKGASSKILYDNTRNNEGFSLVYNPLSRCLPTVSQKPDNILTLEKLRSKVKYEYIFDAKYRINPALDGSSYKDYYKLPGPEEDDINTMHRYRDAIVREAVNKPDFERTTFGAYILFPYNNEQQYKDHQFYKSIEKVNIGGLPFLPSATSLVEELLDELIEDSPESSFERAKLQSGMNEYLENIDFMERNVLIGAPRTKEQYSINFSNNFYHIPCDQIGKCRNVHQLKYVALYQSKENYGEQGGVSYYGEIEYIQKLPRGRIIEIPSKNDPDKLYYRFNIVEWKRLETSVKCCTEVKPLPRLYSNLFLLENSEYVSELCITSKDEYRLLKEIKRISSNVNTSINNNDDVEGYISFEFNGAWVSIRGDKVRVIKNNGLIEYELKLFKSRPTAVMRAIKEFINRQDTNEEEDFVS